MAGRNVTETAPHAPVEDAPAYRGAFAFIFITLLLDTLALGVIIPVLPALIAKFQGASAASAATIYDVFGSAWAAMQFLFSPVLGSLSDRFGRRPVILLSNLGLGLDYALMALAPSIGWLFIGRLISGITSSTFGAANAFIVDVTPAEQRAAKFGLLGVAFGVGFVIGPSVGGLLSVFGLRAPFWASAGLSVANFAYGFFILPESLPRARRAPFHWTRANPLGSLRLLRSHPVLFGLAIAGFLSALAHDSLPSVFVLYTMHRYGWSERAVGLTLALIGVSSIIGTRRTRRPDCRYSRRAARVGRGLRVRCARHVRLRPGAHRSVVPVGCPADGALRRVHASLAEPHDTARGAHRAGTTARSQW